MIWLSIAALFVVAGISLILWRIYANRPISRELIQARLLERLIQGRKADAIDDLRTLYELTGQDPSLGGALATLFRHSGKHQAAIRLHRGLLSSPSIPKPLRGVLLSELAADYLACGLLERAAATVEEAWPLAADQETFTDCAERIYMSLHNWNSAYAVVRKYGKLSKVKVHTRLAVIRTEEGIHELAHENAAEAAKAFQRATRLDPNYLPSHLQLCRLWRYHGKPEKALAYLRKRLPLFKGHEWMAMKEFMKLAICLEDHQAFLLPVRSQLEANSEDWRSRAILGSFLMEIGDRENAATHLLEALHSSPHTLLLHQKLWTLMLRSNQTPGLFQTYCKQLRDDMALTAPFYCTACHFTSERLVWRCPSCFRMRTITERKI